MADPHCMRIRFADLPSVRAQVVGMIRQLQSYHVMATRTAEVLDEIEGNRVAWGLSCPCCGTPPDWGHVSGCRAHLLRDEVDRLLIASQGLQQVTDDDMGMGN